MKKNSVSLTLAFAFLTISVTGILLYLKQKSHPIEISHVIFGLLFMVMALVHIFNNWASLKNYSKPRNTTRLSKEFLVVFVCCVVLLVLSLTSVLEPVAEFGRIFANERKDNRGISFSEKKTNQDKTGKEVFFLVQKNNKAMFTALSIDIIDTENKVIESIYSKDSINQFPPPNLFLNTKIQTKAPFVLQVTLDDKGKKEIHTGEVKTLEAGVYEPIDLVNSKLERLIIEVKK